MSWQRLFPESKRQWYLAIAGGLGLAVLLLGLLVAWGWGQTGYWQQQQAAAMPHITVAVAKPPVAIAPVIPPSMPAPAAIEQDEPPPAAQTETETEPRPEAPTTPAVTTQMSVAPPAGTNITTFDQSDTRPRIILLAADLGPATSTTTSALATLPIEVGAVIWANAPDLPLLAQQLQTQKREWFLAVPAEPTNYPTNDAGPNSLLRNLPAAENTIRLQQHLQKATGYLGIATAMGQQFVADKASAGLLANAAQSQNLWLADTTQNAQSFLPAQSKVLNVPLLRPIRTLDAALGPEAVQAQLQALVELAKLNGQAVGMVLPYPSIFATIRDWSAKLNGQGVVLAPPSAYRF